MVAASLVCRSLTVSLTFWRDFIFYRAIDENLSFQPHKNTGSEWILYSAPDKISNFYIFSFIIFILLANLANPNPFWYSAFGDTVFPDWSWRCWLWLCCYYRPDLAILHEWCEWRSCLKPCLSLLIKILPGWPKNPTRSVTGQWNLRRKQYFCQQAASALMLTKEETLISAFEKAPAVSLRGSPVNKQTVLINTTYPCH